MNKNVFGIVGWKNSGKTTLMQRLIANFRNRGLSIGAVKRAHHAARVDTPGTDSDSYRIAGAGEVGIISTARWALIHELRDEPEPELGDLLAKMSPSDLILVEGFKSAPHQKLVCYREPATQAVPARNIVATAGLRPDKSQLPHFELDAIDEIAAFVVSQVGK